MPFLGGSPSLLARAAAIPVLKVAIQANNAKMGFYQPEIEREQNNYIADGGYDIWYTNYFKNTGNAWLLKYIVQWDKHNFWFSNRIHHAVVPTKYFVREVLLENAAFNVAAAIALWAGYRDVIQAGGKMLGGLVQGSLMGLTRIPFTRGRNLALDALRPAGWLLAKGALTIAKNPLMTLGAAACGAAIWWRREELLDGTAASRFYGDSIKLFV
ncbi:MAG: hypothetical protein ACKO37_08240 [Vampirovibrionales bacterium]